MEPSELECRVADGETQDWCNFKAELKSDLERWRWAAESGQRRSSAGHITQVHYTRLAVNLSRLIASLG